MFAIKNILILLNKSKFRNLSTKCASLGDLERIRNIGILAHIDAGKTTITERMLYYSGCIKQMGEVHHGNTVTDYMEQERNRGITIKSAAVSFPWKKHKFNLIDTPGHIDFTMEVEHSLNVLDGGIIVLDGSAGVEAQTLTVWRQANKYNIARIAFVNKMDRGDASFAMSCSSISDKLDIEALPLQIPIVSSGRFKGIVDLLTLEKHIWNEVGDKQGAKSLVSQQDGKLLELAKASRNKLIDKLSEYDDVFANVIIENDSLDDIRTDDIITAVARVTKSQRMIPVLCGSAYKNIGVQLLMDSVILYLPSAKERSQRFSSFKEGVAAKAFKVLHDKQRGALVFLRIYNGAVHNKQRLFNYTQNLSEQCTKLMVANANDFEDVDCIANGNIAVLTGLKNTITGDFLVSSAAVANQMQSNEKLVEMLDIENIRVPDPVFFRSIEPPSLAYQNSLDQALAELQREDPSMRITHMADTGQTVLAGMGELHLEIIKDRILKEYKIEAELGPLQISYREAALTTVKDQLNYENKIGNSKQQVVISLSLIPRDEHVNEVLKLDKSPDAASNLANLHIKHLNAIKQGIEVGLMHGPKMGAPLINVQIILHYFMVGRGTTESVMAAATTQCIRMVILGKHLIIPYYIDIQLLEKSGSSILEPFMHLEVVTPEDFSSAIIADLNRKRATIENISLKGKNKIVAAEVPLAELMGYSTTMRTMTSGTGLFSMEFSHYKRVALSEENNVIASVRGF